MTKEQLKGMREGSDEPLWKQQKREEQLKPPMQINRSVSSSEPTANATAKVYNHKLQVQLQREQEDQATSHQA